MTIRAEFAEDSRYAAGVYKPELPPGIEKLRFRVVPDRELEAQIRVVDASDRSFQTARTRLAADTHGTLTLRPRKRRVAGEVGRARSRPPPLRSCR